MAEILPFLVVAGVLAVTGLVVGGLFGVVMPMTSALAGHEKPGHVIESIPYTSTRLDLNGTLATLGSYNLTVAYGGATLHVTVDCASFPVGATFPVQPWRYFFVFGENLMVGTLPSGCQMPGGY